MTWLHATHTGNQNCHPGKQSHEESTMEGSFGEAAGFLTGPTMDIEQGPK